MLNTDLAKSQPLSHTTQIPVKFSVIVPVYNTEKYLRQCIDSVLSQQYENLELILVNDGSTDASGEICSEYAKKDGRVVYISKENGGVSSARNVGIRAATGDYVIFLDSDDWMCDDVLQRAGSVIYKTGRRDVYLDSSPEPTFLERANPFEMFEYATRSGPHFLSVWRYILKHDMITQNNILFDEALSWAEDADYLIVFIMKCKSFGCLSFSICNHRSREGSLSYSKRNPDYARHRIIVWTRQCEYFEKAYATTQDKFAGKLMNMSASALFSAITILGTMSASYETEAKHLLIGKRHLLKHTAGWRMAVKKVLYGSIGFGLAPRIIRLVKSLGRLALWQVLRIIYIYGCLMSKYKHLITISSAFCVKISELSGLQMKIRYVY